MRRRAVVVAVWALAFVLVVAVLATPVAFAKKRRSCNYDAALKALITATNEAINAKIEDIKKAAATKSTRRELRRLVRQLKRFANRQIRQLRRVAKREYGCRLKKSRVSITLVSSNRDRIIRTVDPIRIAGG
ncbi:MAG: hypothetical protein ACE5JP_04675 [Candidatus Bipolaricaulia bacterium]